MIETTPNYDVRGTFEVQDDRALGWCWSQQRPSKALRVEVLSDGRVIASGIAARLVPELVRPGVTDGYHGYLFILPERLPENTVLEAREARTGKVFARQLPKIRSDVMAWERRAEQLRGELTLLQDGLRQTRLDEARWSVAWSTNGAWLNGRPIKGNCFEPAASLTLRRFAEPRWTVILDLPRAEFPEATARREVMQFSLLLSALRAELVVIDDGRAASFLAGVGGLRYAAVPPSHGDVARLTAGLGMARGTQIAVFAPVRVRSNSSYFLPDTLRSRAVLLADLSLTGVVISGGAAAAIRGAGLHDLMPRLERPRMETGLLLIASRAVCDVVGALDPAMDDGADLALVDFALRARATGILTHVLEDTPPLRSLGVDPVGPRQAFLRRWLSSDIRNRPNDTTNSLPLD